MRTRKNQDGSGLLIIAGALAGLYLWREAATKARMEAGTVSIVRAGAQPAQPAQAQAPSGTLPSGGGGGDSEFERLGRPDRPTAAGDYLFAPYSGSAWAVQQANSFANWVDSIEIGGYGHITGVIHVSEM